MKRKSSDTVASSTRSSHKPTDEEEDMQRRLWERWKTVMTTTKKMNTKRETTRNRGRRHQLITIFWKRLREWMRTSTHCRNEWYILRPNQSLRSFDWIDTSTDVLLFSVYVSVKHRSESSFKIQCCMWIGHTSHTERETEPLKDRREIDDDEDDDDETADVAAAAAGCVVE